MSARVSRETVDLSEYPDLVVIYLGMRVKSPRGLGRFLRLGRRASPPAGGSSARAAVSLATGRRRRPC